MSEKDNKIEEKELTEVSGGLPAHFSTELKRGDFSPQGPEGLTYLAENENKINIPL